MPRFPLDPICVDDDGHVLALWPEEFRRQQLLLAEGFCPRDHAKLEPEDGWGRCPTCGFGWRLRVAGVEERWMTTDDNPYVIDTAWPRTVGSIWSVGSISVGQRSEIAIQPA